MEKKRALELLIQYVGEIPHLKNLHYKNDELQLWLKKVENLIKVGFEPEDQKKYWEASQFLKYLRGAHEENLMQQDYLNEVVRYEIALKSIIQKYEILGIEGERDKGGEVEMSNNLKQGILDELRTFHTALKSYKRLLDKEGQLSENQKGYRESLREKLVRQSGALKGKIIELTETQYAEGPLTGRFDIWAEAFNTVAMSADRTALAFCINAVNEAIGKLEAEGGSRRVNVTENKEVRRQGEKKSNYQRIWHWIEYHKILSIIAAIAGIATIVGVIFTILNYSD